MNVLNAGLSWTESLVLTSTFPESMSELHLDARPPPSEIFPQWPRCLWLFWSWSSFFSSSLLVQRCHWNVAHLSRLAFGLHHSTANLSTRESGRTIITRLLYSSWSYIWLSRQRIFPTIDSFRLLSHTQFGGGYVVRRKIFFPKHFVSWLSLNAPIIIRLHSVMPAFHLSFYRNHATTAVPRQQYNFGQANHVLRVSA